MNWFFAYFRWPAKVTRGPLDIRLPEGGHLQLPRLQKGTHGKYYLLNAKYFKPFFSDFFSFFKGYN